MITFIQYVRDYHPINGNLFYCFENFLYLYDKGVQVELILVCDSISFVEIVNILNERYGRVGNIKIATLFEVKNNYYKTVVVNSKTLMDLSAIKADEIHLVHSQVSFTFKDRVNQVISKLNSNVIHYNEDNRIRESNYTRTIYFDALIKPKAVDDNVYLHLGGNRAENYDLKKILKIAKMLPKNKPIITSFSECNLDKLKLLKKYLNFVVYNNNVPDMFSRFSTYFYVLFEVYDYSPRMLLESYYLGKEILFLKTGIEDGATNRYKAVQNKNINRYVMNENDFLIKRLLCG